MTQMPPHVCLACATLDRADGTDDGDFAPPRLRTKDERTLVGRIRTEQNHVADKVTAFAGSLTFVYIHAAWFGAWVVVNAGLLGHGLVFDDFPFGLLTMIVSLEAIFLATFVMVSQNRQAQRADVRSQLDFEANLRSEVWSVHIGQTLGLDVDHVEAIVQRAIEGTKDGQD